MTFNIMKTGHSTRIFDITIGDTQNIENGELSSVEREIHYDSDKRNPLLVRKTV